MPKVSFYLRNEDVEAWKAIDKKTQWISDNLNKTPTLEYRKSFLGAPVLTTKSQQELETHFKQKIVAAKLAPIKKGMFDRKVDFCKHGNAAGFCTEKGCK